MAKQQQKKRRFVKRARPLSQPTQSVTRSGATVKIESLYPGILARRPHLEYVLRGRTQSMAYTPDNTLAVLPVHLVGTR